MSINKTLWYILPLIICCESHPIKSDLYNEPKLETLSKRDSLEDIAKNLTESVGNLENYENENLAIFDNKPSKEKLELTKKTLLTITLDSLEIEKFKSSLLGENFMSIIDDITWYDLKIRHKMDSLNIEIITSDKDTVEIFTESKTTRLVKNNSFNFNTYFLFDGKIINRVDPFELLEK